MKRSRRNTKKRSRSFDPGSIATLINQALCRDMKRVTLIYDPTSHPIGRLAEDQRGKFLKKFVDPAVDQDVLVEKTFAKFRKVNSHMEKYSADHFDRPESVRVLSTTPILEAILLKARAMMHNILTDFDEEEWFSQCRNGPGTTVGVKFNNTGLESKTTFPISLTSRVAPLMDRYFCFNFQMKQAAEIYNAANPLSDKYLFVKGSRATTVDKTDEIRRMIAIEPTGNMFFQQGLMHMMYQRMESVGLDVENLQPEHQERARQSSITSKEATIDWSSASDCVSPALLKWLLPPRWYGACELVRSPSMQIDGVDEHLNMFSTMGNAVTFPLETLVFFTIGHALADYRLNNNRSLFPHWGYDWKTVSVFGDDCIVPTTIAHEYISILESVGFLINRDKSFYRDEDHGFRESCGGDYLHGYDVRPYSLRAPSSTALSSLEPWLYTAFNLLKQKYITCFGKLNYVYEKSLFRVFAKLFTEYKIAVKLVPSYFPDDAGLKICEDLERFAMCYSGIKFAKVSKSLHGTYQFPYMRYIYRTREDRSDDLHYVSALQKPVMRESSPWMPVKKKGGYVVAKGISCHWHVPRLN